MQISNFKQFISESYSEQLSVEEQNQILKDIFNDLYEMETSYNIKSRPHQEINMDYGPIMLRGNYAFDPGQIVRVMPDVVELKGVNKMQYGFSIIANRITEKVKNRAVEIFRRQTGISLTPLLSDGYLVLMDKEIARFVDSILLFENSMYSIDEYISNKYLGSISISSSYNNNPLEININFPEGMLKINLNRGIILGESKIQNSSISVVDDVKYNMSINSSFSPSAISAGGRLIEVKNQIPKLSRKFSFEIDTYLDPDDNVKLVYDIIEKNILSFYKNDEIELKENIESELGNLSKYQISIDYSYIDADKIEVNLKWRSDNYHLNVVIKTEDSSIRIIQNEIDICDDVEAEGLSESIYLLLMDGKLKIS